MILQRALVCSGTLSQDSSGVAICDGGWTTTLISVPFDVTQIDPSVAIAAYGAGLFFQVVPWSASVGFRYLLSMVK